MGQHEDSQRGDYAWERPAGRASAVGKDGMRPGDERKASLRDWVYDRLEIVFTVLGVTLAVIMVIAWTSLMRFVAVVGPTTRGGLGLTLLCAVLFYLAASFSYELRHRRWVLLLALSIFLFGEAVHATV